jgi:hypothetical protein
MNYLYFQNTSILLAFPNTYFADLNPQGQFDNSRAVTKEVKMMMDPTADPFAAAPPLAEGEVPLSLGQRCSRFELGSTVKCIYLYGMWSLYLRLSSKYNG